MSPVPLHNQLVIPQAALHRVLGYILTKDSGCWEWIGGKNPKGYGRVHISSVSKSQVLAHRMVYMIANGMLDDSIDVHHKLPSCDKSCVNPLHMEAVPHAEHTVITHLGVKEKTLKTHCVNGHEYTSENTGWYKKGVHVGKRYCRTCVNGRCNARYHATHQPPEPITHCKNGHEFTDENIYWLRAVSGNLTRACRTCRTNRTNEYRERNRDRVLIRRRELRTAKKVA